MHGTHLFGLSNVSQAGLEPAAAAVVAVVTLKFSQCSVLWGSFPHSRGSGGQMFDLVGALFLLDGGEEGKKKKITVGKEGFPRAGPALLAVRVVAVRCN
jgi:hypothetical protein